MTTTPPRPAAYCVECDDEMDVIYGCHRPHHAEIERAEIEDRRIAIELGKEVEHSG